MISTSLNHCKEMGAEPGRRFLKQPAAKLEPVIVLEYHETLYFGEYHFVLFELICHDK